MKIPFSRLILLLMLPVMALQAQTDTNEPLILPIYDNDKPPLAYKEKGEYRGIYIDLFKAVLDEAGIRYRFVPMPASRNQRMFEQGKIAMACCVNPAWYKEPQQQQMQLFSYPLFYTQDMFVFPPGKTFSIDDLAVLRDKRVALVRGYGYIGSENFSERIDLKNEQAVLDFIALGRADVAIVNERALDYWLARHPGAVVKGPVHDRATLHIQLHRNWHELLGPLNQAITTLLDTGTVEIILAKASTPLPQTR